MTDRAPKVPSVDEMPSEHARLRIIVRKVDSAEEPHLYKSRRLSLFARLAYRLRLRPRSRRQA